MTRHRALSSAALGILTLSLTAWPVGAQLGPPVTPGFPNVQQTAGTILSGLNAPQQGRTAIIAYHNGILYTLPELPSSQPGSDFEVRTWDLSDPTAPVETAQLGQSPMPVNAHGYFKSGDYLVVGSNWPPEAPWSFRVQSPGVNDRVEFPGLMCAGTRGCLYAPWFVGPTYWSYGDVEGDAELYRDWQLLASWDHLGETGVIGHPFIVGDLLIFASDQSRTGVATYDISDPTNPVLLDVLTTGGAGGYWPELWGGDGKLYVVFPYRTGGNGIRVVDATDPTDLRFIADTPLPGDAAMYVQFQDEYAFTGSHKVDMRTVQSVLDLDGANTTRPNDGGVGVDTSQFALPIGNLLVTGGIGPHQGMAIWAHQSAPDTRGPSVGFHVPQAGRTGYSVDAPISLLIHETLETPTIVNGLTFIVRPLGGAPIAGELIFSFGDILTFTPDAPLQPDTTYEVVLPAGGITDAAGNGMVGYSFTFSTGSTVGGNRAPEISALTTSAYPATPGQSVALTASASDPDSDPIEYRFDFGDGSASTAWSASASAAHAYAAPGHYEATVQARDTAGSLATRRVTVTALVPPSGPRPTASGPIACDDASRRVWTVNPDADTVSAVHADTLVQDFEVVACDDPRALALDAAGDVWVACHDDDRVVVLDGSSGAELGSIATGAGSAPVGVAAAPDGQSLYVSLQGAGRLARLDRASRQINGDVDLGPTPRAVAVTPDGASVLVTRFLSPRDHAEVWQVDAASMALTRTIKLRKFGGEENRDGTASGKGVANYLVGLVIAPDGESAWVASNKPNTERGLLIADDLDQDNTVRNIVSRLDLGTGTLDRAIDLDNSDSASAVAYSPLGDYLFVTLQGNNEVMVLDALALDDASGLGSLVTRLGTGLAPQGVCVDGSSERVFVQAFMDREVTTLDAGPLLRQGTISLARTDVGVVATEPLAPQVLAGKQIFYNAGDPRMSGEGYMSCATCHLDGGHDGRTWDFTGRGEGLRNTTSLRGRGGMAHGNVHWTANFDEIQDFENDIRGAFGGSGFLDDGDFAATSNPLGPAKAGLDPDLDALAAYVASLDDATLPRSPFRNGASMTAQALAGAAVFEAEGCATCHAGARTTDSTVGTATLHDVGTIRSTSGGRLGGPLPGFDTPTLLGLWNTAPYFHDGSAPRLEDVFVVAGGTLLPAEDGALSGGASVVDQWVHLNNDDTVRGRAYVNLDGPASAVTFAGVDGGAGGLGAVEVRYSTSPWSSSTLEVSTNGGAPIVVALQNADNEPSWRHTNWLVARVEDLPLNPGTSNTVRVATGSNGNVSVDDILVTSPDDRTAAQPHRRVLALSGEDRDNLLAFLRQLDGRPATDPASVLFMDGFETGDLSAWD
ncbi:MAG: Ig-like domain-containing protein [Acidobacteriota bacterium]